MINSVKEIHLILEKVVDEVNEGKTKIFNILENLRTQLEKDKIELDNVINELQKVILEVDELEKKDRDMRKNLSYASSNLKTDEEVIQDIYNRALEVKVLFISKQKEEKELRIKRDKLELALKNYLKNIEEAEGVINQINIVVNYLCGDFGTSIDNLEELNQKDMTIRILEIQEEERKRIAREVHDGPAQYLASALMRMDLCKKLIKEDFEQGLSEIDELKVMVNKALKEVRSVIYNLRPPYLNKQSLEDSIQDLLDSFVDESKMKGNLKILHYQRCDERVEIGVYRIIQELLNNSRKHSKAHSVTVTIEKSPEILHISFKDDGIGFSVNEVIEESKSIKNSYGIIGIKDRVEGFGGEVTINSSNSSGTKYYIKIPV